MTGLSIRRRRTGKSPKVERINEILEALRDSIDDDRMKLYLRLIEEGLTYSDVLLLLKWYKVLPR